MAIGLDVHLVWSMEWDWGRGGSEAGGSRTWSEVGWGAHVPLIHSF